MKQLLAALVMSIVLMPSYALTDKAGVVSVDSIQLDTLVNYNFDIPGITVGADTVVVSSLADERPAINSERPRKVSAGLKREKFTEPILDNLKSIDDNIHGDAGNTS